MEIIKKLFKKGFFHIFGGSIINKMITFMSSVILIRILSKSEYGVFTYSWNIYSILILLSGMGIVTGTLQLSSEHSDDPNHIIKITNYGTRFGIKFNILLGLIVLFIGLFAPLKIEDGRIVLSTLCFLPIIQLAYSMVTTTLRANKRNKEYAYISVLSTILIFVMSAGFSIVFRQMGLVIGQYISYIFSLVIGIKAFKVHIISKQNNPIPNEEKRDLLKISFISMMNDGLSQLMYLLDVFVLGIVDPQETILASYKVATMIPSALTFIPLSLIIYLYPYFAEHQNDGKWCLENYKKILVAIGFVNLIISLTMFFASPLIIRLLYGNQYMDSLTVFKILAINYFFSGTFRILSGNLLVTQRKLKFNLIVAIISSSTNIIADYFFIQWWGSIGAAFATVLVVMISSIMSTSYLVYIFRRKSC